jgi:hypothetical protein
VSTIAGRYFTIARVICSGMRKGAHALAVRSKEISATRTRMVIATGSA